jgi:hypothetical protein
MAHRNRWFTVLKNGGSFHGKLLNNQLVTEIVYGIFGMQRYAQLDSIRPSGDIRRSANLHELRWVRMDFPWDEHAAYAAYPYSLF